VNKLRTTGLLIDKKKNNFRFLTEVKLDDIGASLEHTPGKSLKRLAQETGVSKPSARMATQMLKPSRDSWYLLYVCFLTKQLLAEDIYV
jgi:hypothetical protein